MVVSMNIPYTVVIGLGETGFSCVEYLLSQQIAVMVLDSRSEPPLLMQLKKKYPQVPVMTGCFPADVLSHAASIVLSPGISAQHADIISAVSSNTEIIGDIELFARLLERQAIEQNRAVTPVIAITGSNGKSTVTSLVGHMARTDGYQVAVGGNLGVPALTLMSRFQKREHRLPELYVLELSSFQLETTYTLKPLVATVLNICPDHLDRYPSVEAYHAAKQRIFQHCQKAVVNSDDALSGIGIPTGVAVRSFGLTPVSDFSLKLVDKEEWLVQGSVPLLAVSELKILGRHNIANALAALSIGWQAGFSKAAMLSALRTFVGLPHRGEWVKKQNDILWINDSKGTNVGATLATLTGVNGLIPGKWILIAGGAGKNADFSPLQRVVAQYCRAVILIGKEADTVEKLVQVLGSVVPCQYADSMEEAVCLAAQKAKPGDGVLLSPACASLDMFKNFEERGEAFKNACAT